MSDIKVERAKEHLKDLAAQFLGLHSNKSSLITVTDIILSYDMHQVTIRISVLPKEKAAAALQFANRQRQEFREFVKKNSRMRVLPSLTFALDLGEENRQRIETLLSQTNKDGGETPQK